MSSVGAYLAESGDADHRAVDHYVQFYDDDAVLLSSVGAYLLEHLRQGAAGIVIATREHLVALERACAVQQVDLSEARSRGQYRSIDATEMLDRLTPDGWPSRERFKTLIEPLFEKTSASYSKIVAFGEMVGLLWRSGRFGAAIRLEELWNELRSRVPFGLYCAYPLAADPAAPVKLLRDVCAAHTAVIVGEQHRTDATGTDYATQMIELQHKAAQLEREVNARRAMQRVLAEREQQLTEFLEHAPLPIHSVGADGSITWANQAELSLLGYERSEYVGHPAAKFYVDPGVIDDMLTRLYAGEMVQGLPAQLRCKDDTVRHVLIDANALLQDGRFLQSRCFLRDVTAARQMSQAQALLAAIVNGSDDAIVSKSLDGIISSWNPGAERLFGYSAAEAIGQPITMLVPPELREQEREILARLRRGERIEHLETVRVAKDGRRIDVSLTVSPVRDHSGTIIGASKVARDISERNRRAMLEREAGKRKDEFLAMLGHELRNPLAPIANGAVLLRQLAGTEPRLQFLSEMFDRQIGTMRRLLDDLLDVSRITQGKILFQREPVDIRSAIEAAIEMSRPLIEERRQGLEVKVADEPLWILGDATRLAQALGNLLNNACKYTPEGGRIALEASPRDGWVEVQILDNGVGIPEALLPQIFDLFVQADHSVRRSVGGLGVGLTLVRGIAQQHGGSVSAYSGGLGLGSLFTLRLPQLATTQVPVAANAAVRLA
jgi:PAS domain S-box-containing protein